MSDVLLSRSEADTERVAGEIAKRLGPGSVLALEGPMGAGKTRLTRGLVRAMGGEQRAVSSPTFVLMNEYAVGAAWGGVMYHLDAYRVGGADDFEAIGFEELLEQGGVVVVEWPSRVASLLPAGTVWVRIRPTGETEREFEILPAQPGG